MTFVPDDYENVETRIRNFYADHPQGRIITDVISLDGDAVTFRASVYRELDPDPHPASTGHAHGLLVKPKAVEFIETVSIGRALANLNYAKQGARASAEEMQAFEESKTPGGARTGSSPSAAKSTTTPPGPTSTAKPSTRPHGGTQPGATASERQVKFARLLIDTVEEGPQLAAQYLGSTPLEMAPRGDVSRLIEDLKTRKEEAMKQVTRTQAADPDDPWHMQEPPEEVL